MKSWSFTIDDWLPCTTNQLLRAVGRRGRLKRSDRELIWWASLALPKATGKRRVSAKFVYPKSARMRDVDSMQKSLLDSLAQCDLIKSDHPRWCELGPWTSVRGERLATVVTLEEVVPS